ncbi:phosphate signaling complex protein PhoU [Palleronia caenipelagi]|uniref:Phosphate-specific transport system accessory protein PhoU n=1 Tax=Palleronia caenipelagi TaxID=2489174 RepID=A0A547Q623_9RHOB|nr:phosphate signaling complex protein PhoU [Palleronia caenipelagi]TRD21822.1 phosphate signaling complex protein PhoU [Palleronia caenipelagi]
MNGEHIHSAFDRDLEQLQADLVRMAGLVEQALRDATNALVTHDTELAAKVRREDKRIDALEDAINEEAARLIALRAPLAGDMRLVLSVIKISGHLERMGDYAKNMAKRTDLIADHPMVETAPAVLKRMANQVIAMMHQVVEAHISQDSALAHEVRDSDAEVDQMYNSIFRVLLTYMMEDPRQIAPCMHLHFIAKNLERIGDHTTSIADQVIYAVDGLRPDEDRPKADLTSVKDLTGS